MAELNHHNDPTGLAASARQASKPNFLGSHELVDRLVRGFVSDIMARFDQVASARMTPNDAAAEDSKACVTMGAVFSGEDKRFEAQPNWTGTPVADFIRGRMHSAVQPGTDSEVIAQAFAVLAHEVYDAIRENQPEEEMIDRLNEAVRSLVGMLLGVEAHE